MTKRKWDLPPCPPTLPPPQPSVSLVIPFSPYHCLAPRSDTPLPSFVRAKDEKEGLGRNGFKMCGMNLWMQEGEVRGGLLRRYRTGAREKGSIGAEGTRSIEWVAGGETDICMNTGRQ